MKMLLNFDLHKISFNDIPQASSGRVKCGGEREKVPSYERCLRDDFADAENRHFFSVSPSRAGKNYKDGRKSSKAIVTRERERCYSSVVIAISISFYLTSSSIAESPEAP